tara:strand:+ start:210 stop:788 length:579 start_codon:yes stop_codon:yes gene_type:complete
LRKVLLGGVVLAAFLLSPAVIPPQYVVSYSPPAIPTAVVLIAPESAPDVGIGATTLPDVTQHTATYGNEAHFVTEWQLMEVLAQTSWRPHVIKTIQIEDESYILDKRPLRFLYALMLCESGGKEDAVGDLDLGVSLGIFQINISYWPRLHKEYNLLDAEDNAQAAYVVWKAMGFKAWSCYGGEPVPIQSISE